MECTVGDACLGEHGLVREVALTWGRATVIVATVIVATAGGGYGTPDKEAHS